MSDKQDLLNQIISTKDTTESDYLVQAIEDPVSADTTPLSSSGVSYVNELNKEVNGDEAMEILTEQDLQDADRTSMEKLVSDDLDVLNRATVEDIQKGAVDFKTVSQRGYQYAVLKAREEYYKGLPYGLTMEAGRMYADEAVSNNPEQNDKEQDEFYKGVNRVATNKLMIQQELAKRYDKASWYGLTGSMLWSMVPGVSLVNAKDSLINPEEGKLLDPAAARELNADQWDAMMNDLSNEEFATKWKEYVNTLESRGFSSNQIAMICADIMDPSPKAETLGAVGDIFAGVGTATKAAKGFVYGAKGQKAVEAAAEARKITKIAEGIKDADKALKMKAKAEKATEKATKLAKEANMPMTTVEKIVDSAEGAVGSGVAEAWSQTVPVVGELLGEAAKGTLHVATALPKRFMTRASRKGLFEDIAGETADVADAIKAGRLTDENVLETKLTGAVPDALKPTETATENIAAANKVKTELDYQDSLLNAATLLRQGSHLQRTQQELTTSILEKANTALSQLEGYRSTNLGNLVRLTRPDDLVMESTGELVARVRADKPGKKLLSYEEAKKLANDISFKAKDAIGEETGLSIQAFPMPLYTATGKKKGWKVDADIHLNTGFGIAFEDAAALDKKMKGWKAHKLFFPWNAMFSFSANPVSLKRLGHLRSLQAEQLVDTGRSAERSFKSLKRADKGLFRLLADHSIDTGTFFNTDYLKEKGVSDDLLKAYTDWRRMNDLDYLVINSFRRDTMVRQGIKNLSVGDKVVGYGRVLRTDIKDKLNTTTRNIIFDSFQAEPKSLNKLFGDNLTPEQINSKIDELVQNGYVLVERTYGPDKALKGHNLYYLIDGHNLIENDLPEFVTNYVAGGRRFFDRRSAFVKQANYEKSESGADKLLGVNTIAADLDEVGLTRKVKGVERIRHAIATGEDTPDNFSKIIKEEGLSDVPFTSFGEFREWAKEHNVDVMRPHAKLEVVKDGQMLSSINEFMGETLKTLDPDDLQNMLHRSAFMALTEEAKVQKMMRQGKDLLSWNFKDTLKIADYDRNIQMMVSDMVNMGVMSKWDDFYCDLFYQQFAALAKKQGADISTLTPRQFLYKVWSPNGGSMNLSPEATAAAKNYWAIKGVPTSWDMEVAKGTVGLFKDLEDMTKVPLRVAHGLNIFGQKVDDLNPLRKLRIFTSIMTMACAPAQFIKQAAPAAYAIMTNLKASPYIAKYAIPVFLNLLSYHGSEMKALEKYAKRLGGSKTDFAGLMDYLIKANIMAPTGLGGLVEGGKGDSMNRIMFAFKNSGELFNRMVAHMAAYYEAGYAGTKGIDNEIEFSRVLSKGESLFMNMGATGMSRVQTSEVAKTAFQFQSYFWRWIETLCFDREMTSGDKISLAVGMMSLSGITTVAGANGYIKSKQIFNALSDDNEGYSLEDKQGAFDRIWEIGLINSLMEWCGWNADMGDTIAIPVADMAGKGITGMVWPVPAWTASEKALKGARDLITTLSASYHVKNYLTANDFVDALTTISQEKNAPSGLSQTMLALSALKTGKAFNKAGQLTEEGNNKLLALRQLMGLRSTTDIDIAIRNEEAKSYEEKEKDYEKEMRVLINAQFSDPDNPAIQARMKLIKDGSDLSDEDQLVIDQKLRKYAPGSRMITYDEMLLMRDLKKRTGSDHLILKYNRGEQ